jgi:hypothetical protein
MKPPYVCTEQATHRRIVSRTLASRGASAYQIKTLLIDSQSAEGSKTQIRNPHLNSQREHLILGTIIDAGSGSQSEIPNLLEVLDLTLISLIYSLTPGSNLSSVQWASAKTQNSQTSLLCDARSHKSHIKSLNVTELFCTSSSHQRRNASNSKNSQNKKSLKVTDSEPKPLIYSLTAGSNFYSVQWPSAKTPQSFRLSFALFVFFVVNPLFKSPFRNPLWAHETLDYRRLLEIIGFRNLSKNQPTNRTRMYKKQKNVQNYTKLFRSCTRANNFSTKNIAQRNAQKSDSPSSLPFVQKTGSYLSHRKFAARPF